MLGAQRGERRGRRGLAIFRSVSPGSENGNPFLDGAVGSLRTYDPIITVEKWFFGTRPEKTRNEAGSRT